MESKVFTSIATFRLPLPSRLLHSSWCPDKDLLVIVSQQGNKDRLSLWKMQGSKKWEIDMDSEVTGSETIVDVAWSPDRQTIAIAHNPPRVTLHSIQDGHQERSLPMTLPISITGRTARLTRIWWFEEEKKTNIKPIPDIFRRNNDITGSAHSILKEQPLLDPLSDESQPLTATDLFAFQTARAHTFKKKPPPGIITTWPTLPSDRIAASIKPPRSGNQQPRPGEELDEIDDTNLNSILVVSDDDCRLHPFLDGSYPLGTIPLGIECTIESLFHLGNVLYAHPQVSHPSKLRSTSLRPTIIRLPFLQQRTLRDIARVSSATRELAWYSMRVVKEMLAVWFGTTTNGGARELGPTWMIALNRKEEQFGVDDINPRLALLTLLTTGRASEALLDFMGSNEQMSERGLQKWETTVVDALVKLRDYSEKRVGPACQRLHILLEEVRGWSQLPQYALCELKTHEVDDCLQLAGRAIVICSWLAATARQELARFKEFISWLRYETSRMNAAGDPHNHITSTHDILEVNDYLAGGIIVSPIDRCFVGRVPHFSMEDIGVTGNQPSLSTAIERARSVLNNPAQLSWNSKTRRKDLSHLDRNLDSLIQELATRCSKIFVEAANATARSATVEPGTDSALLQNTQQSRSAEFGPPQLLRERTVQANGEAAVLQYMAIHTPRVDERTYLCVARVRHAVQTAAPVHVSIALLECCVTEENDDGERATVPFDLLDAEFFDEETLIIVYRPPQRAASIATVGYAALEFATVKAEGTDIYVSGDAQEGLMHRALRLLEDGQVGSVPMPVLQSRVLISCGAGDASLAVNGRRGRRVAGVLDGAGVCLEVLDMEGELEEEEVEEDSSGDKIGM